MPCQTETKININCCVSFRKYGTFVENPSSFFKVSEQIRFLRVYQDIKVSFILNIGSVDFCNIAFLVFLLLDKYTLVRYDLNFS